MNIKLNNTSSENKQINTKEYVIDTKIITVLTGQQLRDYPPKPSPNCSIWRVEILVTFLTSYPHLYELF